jgi:hypothetical protein
VSLKINPKALGRRDRLIGWIEIRVATRWVHTKLFPASFLVLKNIQWCEYGDI